MSETSNGEIGQVDQAIPFSQVANEYKRHRYLADVMTLHKQGIQDLEASLAQREMAARATALGKEQEQDPCSSAGEQAAE